MAPRYLEKKFSSEMGIFSDMRGCKRKTQDLSLSLTVVYYQVLNLKTPELSCKFLVNSACHLVTYVGKDLVIKLVSNPAPTGSL